MSRFACLLLLLLAASAQAELRDPTAPPASAGGVAEEPVLVPLALQGVVRSGRNPLALINGQRVRLGGEVDGARLLSIRSNAVLLERQGKREWLRLAPSILKPSR